jgi:hypothetical protein
MLRLNLFSRGQAGIIIIIIRFLTLLTNEIFRGLKSYYGFDCMGGSPLSWYALIVFFQKKKEKKRIFWVLVPD